MYCRVGCYTFTHFHRQIEDEAIQDDQLAVYYLVCSEAYHGEWEMIQPMPRQVLYYIIVHNTTPNYPVQHYTVLHYTALHYTTLH